MREQRINPYDFDGRVAEIYDQVESHTRDVNLIRSLIGKGAPIRVLEPFCGTGRILIPLALDGHTLVGLDQAVGMLRRGGDKIAALDAPVSERISLAAADVIQDPWPGGFDLVLLGGNCFYELAAAEEQERCVAAAAGALKPGGYLYVDNDHMEGELAASWRQAGVRPGFPSGVCADGTRLESTTEVVWWDGPNRLARFRRRTRIIAPDGTSAEVKYEQVKHPVSAEEVRGWLSAYGFKILRTYGNHAGDPYHAAAERAIFWAQEDGNSD